MNNKVLTVSIIGAGNRGASAYGKLMFDLPDKYKIVSLCEVKEERRNKYQKEFQLLDSNVFSDEKEFFATKRSDLLIIATMDKDHVRQCITALQLGYDVLLEKPISDDITEIEKLLQVQRQTGHKVIVCHVLRYGASFNKVKELLNANTIGKLVDIQAMEQVAFWHYAQAYVRGDFRNTDMAFPSILAKCCHDLDLIQWYAQSKCKAVSSCGSCFYFNKDNKPEGASNNCMACKYIDSCSYSTKNIYLNKWHEWGCPKSHWLHYKLTTQTPLTEEVINNALVGSSLDKCVFSCDNNVCDNQIVSMHFANGVNATLTMTAFTKDEGRVMRFHGTDGEILLDCEQGQIVVKPFHAPTYVIPFSQLNEATGGHGSADSVMIQDLYNIITGAKTDYTSLEESLQSHVIGYFAEQSRLNGGKAMSLENK